VAKRAGKRKTKKKAARKKTPTGADRLESPAGLPVVDPDPPYVTATGLIAALQIGQSTLARWRHDGLEPDAVKRGGARTYLWVPDRVRQWAAENGKDRDPRSSLHPDRATPQRNERGERPIDAAKRRREEALADRYELELARDRGELVPRAEVCAGLVAKVTVLRQRLLNLADSLPAELADEDPDAIRERLIAQFEHLCRDFGSGVNGIKPKASDLEAAAQLLGLTA
jgi:hypothetical protein